MQELSVKHLEHCLVYSIRTLYYVFAVKIRAKFSSPHSLFFSSGFFSLFKFTKYMLIEN